MRRVLLLTVAALLLLCLPGMSEAQDFIRYYPPSGLSELTSSGTAITSTVPFLLPDGTAGSPSLSFASDPDTGIYRLAANLMAFSTAGGVKAGIGVYGGIQQISSAPLSWSQSGAINDASDVFLYRDAANTLALRNSTNAQQLNVYNSFTTYGSNYGMFSIVASATGTDLVGTGAGATAATGGLRSIQGSKSKTLTDTGTIAFARLSVADDDYEGCTVIYTVFAEDAEGDARQTRTGTMPVAILNNSGTETCAFGTGDSAVVVTAGTLTCGWTCPSAAADTVDLTISCNTSLDAAAETLTFEWRLNCPSTLTVTPQ